MGEAAMERPPGNPAASAEGDEQGEQMLVTRMREAPIRPLLSIGDQRLLIASRNALGQPVIERQGPGRRLFAIDVELPQIVDRAAARQHEHALAAQRLQGATDLRVMGRAELHLYRQLRHRHVGLRVHQQQRIPGAVIETVIAIDAAADARLLEQLDRAARERGRARRRIAQPVELIGEAVEVVDRLRRGGGADSGPLRFPMGGDAEDRLGSSWPSPVMNWRAGISSNTNMGEPWEMNRAGSVCAVIRIDPLRSPNG